MSAPSSRQALSFSAEPAETGWDPGRIARAWAELMRRLDYTRYVAQGGDQGAAVTDAMGAQAPEGLLGIHLHEEVKISASVVSIDGVSLKQFDFVDIGALMPSSGAVPVVIKSLVFPSGTPGK